MKARPERAVVVVSALIALAIVVAVLALVARAGSGGDASAQRTASSALPRATADRFDGARALRLAALQLRYGPRPAGSAQLRALAVRLQALLGPGARLEEVPGHPGERNVVLELAGREPGKALVVGAHYDTEPNVPRFVGANDGAAGTAIVVELARVLRRLPLDRPVQLVLFDGEELPLGGTDARFAEEALRGSKAYVAAHRAELGEMVLLDFVGNRGLRLPREATSNEALWRRVRTAARAVGVGSVFPAGTGTGIIDDHTPFLQAGIPAVDFIDWPYRYYHVPADTLDKLDPRALDAVGEAVTELVRRSATAQP